MNLHRKRFFFHFPATSKQILKAAALVLAVALVLCLPTAPALRADTLSGTVKDPSGAVVPDATVTITGGALAQPLVLKTDKAGQFSAPDLKPGTYSVRVEREGFAPQTIPVELKGTADVPVALVVLAQQTSVTVSEKLSSLANADPVYKQLRSIGMGESYECKPFKMQIDAATFEFKSGTFTFLQPINGIETGVVFVGQGHFSLTPVLSIDAREMQRRAGAATAEEDFTEVVFRFTHDGVSEFTPGIGAKTAAPSEAGAALARWKERVRRRHEIPEGMTQEVLEGATIDNVDADVLAAIYNPKHPRFFNAYMHGSPHKDFRYYVRTRVGAIPQMDSSEEVGLINENGQEMDDGIWYLSHTKDEILNRTASSGEEKRLFAAKQYKIETVIGKNNHVFGIATITFSALIPGERLMKFGLLPNLRVTRVKDEGGQELHFIQENRKEDGSFYALLDAPVEVGKDHSITVEYAGDKVIQDAGDGSYFIGARESWYPNLDGDSFSEHSLFDLTFKVPHNYKIISVGELKGESTEDGFAVTHWVTPIPVAIAGFNYGDYKKLDITDSIQGYKISAYYLPNLPAVFQQYEALRTLAPKSMTAGVLDQTRAQVQVCTMFFGKIPYETINVTEQPDFGFGQSWPNLIYLPISAYTDSTQRWELFGRNSSELTGFVQEVTPHEVSHQWWGHAVGWASYHDQWLSEGFADFSAGLFLQQAMGPKWQKDYLDYWERQKKHILEKNNFGVAATDAGPLWLGLRLITPKSESAYQSLTYPKGAFVLQMIRSLFYVDNPDEKNHDAAFIDMMHDFVASHHDKPASTESFKAIVEKHMPKNLDLQKNGRMDWFFNEWVYGTMVPKYEFRYELQPADGGKTKLHMTLTQSEVDDHFAMFVPVFADFGHGMQRLGQIPIAGNNTRTIDYLLPAQPKKVTLNYYMDVLAR